MSASGSDLAPRLRDGLGRALRDLRISLTDRCNFRCGYCMPKEVYNKHFRYLPHSSLLRFEEISRLARLFAQLGVDKVRLTGGEPLLRKGIESLIAQLKSVHTPEKQPLEVALTTNASLLSRMAGPLKEAGLDRITISLDALDDAVFRAMNDVDFPVDMVLRGLQAAEQAGFERIKINMVVKKGQNEEQIIPMIRYFLNSGHILRFIEYMDVGSTNGWRMQEVMPANEILEHLQTQFTLQTLPSQREGETAKRYILRDTSTHEQLEIGVVASVTGAFCGDCNRARLSTEGKLYLCLFAHQGYDIRSLVRSGASDEAILADIRRIWLGRIDRYSELRAQGTAPQHKRIEMSYIGG